MIDRGDASCVKLDCYERPGSRKDCLLIERGHYVARERSVVEWLCVSSGCCGRKDISTHCPSISKLVAVTFRCQVLSQRWRFVGGKWVDMYGFQDTVPCCHPPHRSRLDIPPLSVPLMHVLPLNPDFTAGAVKQPRKGVVYSLITLSALGKED